MVVLPSPLRQKGSNAINCQKVSMSVECGQHLSVLECRNLSNNSVISLPLLSYYAPIQWADLARERECHWQWHAQYKLIPKYVQIRTKSRLFHAPPVVIWSSHPIAKSDFQNIQWSKQELMQVCLQYEVVVIKIFMDKMSITPNIQ